MDNVIIPSIFLAITIFIPIIAFYIDGYNEDRGMEEIDYE